MVQHGACLAVRTGASMCLPCEFKDMRMGQTQRGVILTICVHSPGRRSRKAARPRSTLSHCFDARFSPAI